MPITLLEFSVVNDACAATTSKLKKQAILSDYFRAIEADDDLRLAVRYAAGRVFSSTDQRVLGASGAIVGDAIRPLLKIDRDALWKLVVAKGEIGEALAEAWGSARVSPAQKPVSLQDIALAFEDLSQSASQERKREILRDLFARCTHRREAAYLAKIIFSDLRTGVREAVLQSSIARAFEASLAEVQQAQLLLGDISSVAILAKHDRLSDARFTLFHPVQFMLATPHQSAQDVIETTGGRTYFAEDKLDGIRAQVHKSVDGRIAIYTRTMDRTDESFPEVVESLRQIPGEFLIDGELVPYRDGVVLPFAHIQKRLGRKVLTQKILRENPVVYIAFDILYHAGELLMNRPLRERRAVLETLMSAAWITRVTDVSTAPQVHAAFALARSRRNEGLVLKDPESIYSPGKRGHSWLKLKTHLPTIDCVVTAAEYGHGKRRGVLSDYTFAVWDLEPSEANAKLVNIGKAFSGVTDEEIAQLTTRFLELSIAHRGHVHLVEPQVVLEVACDQIQKSKRHTSGYALRFPRIKRIRWDKKPEDADRLARIVQLYESTSNTARGTTTHTAEPGEPTLFDGL